MDGGREGDLTRRCDSNDIVVHAYLQRTDVAAASHRRIE